MMKTSPRLAIGFGGNDSNAGGMIGSPSKT